MSVCLCPWLALSLGRDSYTDNRACGQYRDKRECLQIAYSRSLEGHARQYVSTLLPSIGTRRLLGYKLSRDIFMEHAADQGVIGHSFHGGTVLEGLEVHPGESNSQALRFR